MKKHVYIALLRGINVGGNNIIKMADLREVLTEASFEHVSTHIASGNVVLVSTSSSVDGVTKKLKQQLKKAFNYTQPVLVLPEKEVRKILNSAPKEFGTKPKVRKYDVMYLLKPATPAMVFKKIPLREGVDEAEKGYRAIFFSRKQNALSKSYLSKVAALPEYQKMTIRNWNTSQKLLEMLDDAKKKITA